MSKFADAVPVRRRSKFADLVEDVPQAGPYQSGSIADLIERFVKEMDGFVKADGEVVKGVRPLGYTHRYVLKRLQHAPIAKVLASELKKSDVIDHCRERRKTVCGATAMQDIASLVGVLKYAGAAWTDCDKISDATIKAAKPFLTKHNLIGKSTPRRRRPTTEEKAALEAYFAKQNEHPRTTTDMVRVSRWQRASSRRISESCALLWRDWLPDDQTILVRKMKDPKNRTKQKVVALPWDAQDLLFEWAHEMNDKPELRNDEQRILPYSSKTCSARYTLAKNELGIVGLRLHDDRRDRGSRLVEEDGHSAEEAIQYTGHDTTAVYQKTYMVLNAAVVAQKGRRLREAGGSR